MLLDQKHEHLICWTSNDGEFKLLKAEEVAKLWGLRKNKTNMNYDKLSRALRYYYDKVKQALASWEWGVVVGGQGGLTSLSSLRRSLGCASNQKTEAETRRQLS